MGIKMKIASYEGKEVNLSNIKDYMKRNLKCIVCGVDVTYTKPYKRRCGDKEIDVAGYFRISNKEHNLECKYNTLGEIKRIVADVPDKDLVSEVEENKFVVKLNLISDKIKEQKEISNGDFLNYEVDSELKSKKIYEAGKRISAYLSTMKKIIRLRDEVDNNSDLSSNLQLEYYNNIKAQNEVVRWSNFYYEYNNGNDFKDYIKAYKYLSKRRYHPVCFEGIIKYINSPNDKFNKYSISFYDVLYSDENNKKIKVILQLHMVNDDIIQSLNLNKDNRILVYGNFRTYEREFKGIVYQNIISDIYHKNQIYIEKSN
ncbi:hypothetical protein [Clostridium sp. ZBS12]|uniref:hypothetical protein n=1 Tax=Clostridium sp. ZBS12 TaxID=2949972 RepID=UPI0020799934|nr:hypothetical protein [Clostridium sp. ZBS12]